MITIHNGRVGGSQRLPIRGFARFERQTQETEQVAEPVFEKGGHLAGSYLAVFIGRHLANGTIQLVQKDEDLKFEVRFGESNRSPVLDERQVGKLLSSIRGQNFAIVKAFDNGGDANVLITPLGNRRVKNAGVRFVVTDGRPGIEFPTSLTQQ